jgi:hypothetical protein
VLANVTERGGTEQGIGDGVQHDVGIGMTEKPKRMCDCHTAEDEWPSFNKTMRIMP